MLQSILFWLDWFGIQYFGERSERDCYLELESCKQFKICKNDWLDSISRSYYSYANHDHFISFNDGLGFKK